MLFSCLGGLDRGTLLIDAAVFAIAALAAIVAVYPVLFYVTKGWAWRAEVITTSLGSKAKNDYLALYHKDKDTSDPDERFKRFYLKWYGRTRLGAPTAIVAAITFIYALMMATAASQALWRYAPSTIPILPHHIALGAMAGAYTLISLDSIGRVAKRDLSPEDLYLQALRLAAAVPIGYAFYVLNPASAPFLSFAVAGFPLQQIADIIRQQALKQLGQTPPPPSTAADALTGLAGIDTATADRFNAVGVNTTTELAYGDPVQLTMRTNSNFNFVLDLQSQALAWVYFETKLVMLRPMGLRGAYELCVLQEQAADPSNVMYTNAQAVVAQAAAAISLTKEEFANALYQIAGDDYVRFLVEAYGQPAAVAARPASALTAASGSVAAPSSSTSTSITSVSSSLSAASTTAGS